MITLTITIKELTPLIAETSGTVTYPSESTDREVAALKAFDILEWKEDMYIRIENAHRLRQQPKPA